MMRSFSELFEELDTTTSTGLKVAAMKRYFATAAPADAAWAAYMLSGRRLKRFLGPALLRRWLIEASRLPEWLVDECQSSVGDFAETVALLMETNVTGAAADVPLSRWIEERLLPLRASTESRQKEAIVSWWRTLPYRECFLLNKLLTGELRVGVSELLLTRSLAEVLNVGRSDIARRLMGDWRPSAELWESLRSGAEPEQGDPAAPYPFYLASPLEGEPQALGERSTWLAEWKWDGIRSQLIRRKGRCFIWSRGEELITERFPELVDAAMSLPEGVVLDGELVAWKNGGVQPFADLQQRIGRKKLTADILQSVPVRFLAYDLLEQDYIDLRSLPLRERRQRLEALIAKSRPDAFGMSASVETPDWSGLATLREESRTRGVEGFMLKSLDSPYETGRKRGSWWKWKIDPYSFDAVLLYAQPGHGRRSNLYTDYTFGVWDEHALVPVAKAYSGLSDAEIAELDRWIRSHTTEKFGPVRSVEQTQVFELAYEGIAASTRHKSGIALRFPRILRRRLDKPASEADTLKALQEVLSQHRVV
ncbi:MAG TPA: ATP-dependent DNA ligase [Steroidobacteraceae bacterium]|nr:ATP-dependent DNA ligase [Steroidobacteraceae bacterium]